LDSTHPSFNDLVLQLYSSEKAKAAGIYYLDREVRTVAFFEPQNDREQRRPIQIYGNPLQPDFLDSSYAFTYLPHPSEEASKSWTSAPSRSDGVHIWVMHGPPKSRLDWIPIDGLQGCVAQAEAIARARPLLCVFGHYHISNGVERVEWKKGVDELGEVRRLTEGNRRREFDFSGHGGEAKLEVERDTVFVNAAWMTHDKRKVTERNMPIVITLPLSVLATRESAVSR
jgi:hypothetical protein